MAGFKPGVGVALLALALDVHSVLACTTEPGVIAEVSPVQASALVGTVSVWPASPVERVGVGPAEPVPLPGLTVIVSGFDLAESISAVTDESGGYWLPLPPGTYAVDIETLPEGAFSKELPATVTIAEAEEARLDIHVDFGLR